MAVSHTNGYDIFFTNPGKLKDDECACGVCGTTCVVSRNENGPTGMAEAMAKRGHVHDTFRCPHSGSQWHDKALELTKELDKFVSSRLRALVQADLDDLLNASLPERKYG